MLSKRHPFSLRRLFQRRRGERSQVARAGSRRVERSAPLSLEPLEPRVLMTVFTGTMPFTVFTNQLDEQVIPEIPAGATYVGRPGVPNQDVVNVRQVTFSYNDVTHQLTFGTPEDIAQTAGADGLEVTLDNQFLIVGGGVNDGSLYKIQLSSGAVQTTNVNNAVSFHVTLDPAGDKVWTSDQPGVTLAEVSTDPFGTVMATHTISGDDPSLTQLVFVDDNGTQRIFYTLSDRDGGDGSDGDGFFGEVNPATFATRRINLTGNINDNIESAHAAEYDPFTNSIFIAGGKRITQLQIPQGGGDPQIVADLDLSPFLDPLSEELVVTVNVPFFGNQNFGTGTELALLDHVEADGQGHLFFTLNSGHVGLIDFRASGLISDAPLITDSGTGELHFLQLDLDDIGIILDEQVGPPEVNIEAIDPDASEEGPDDGVYRISRTGSTASSLDVQLSFDGSAVVGQDVVAFGSIIRTIPAGESFVDLVITPIDDSEPEANEFLSATINPQGTYTIGANSVATITIADNDQGGGGDSDFGDAPASYGIAQHTLGSGPTLGSTADAEVSSQFSANADGDDSNDTDDEDGVFIAAPFQRGVTNPGVIQVFVGQGGIVDAWIDFNGDGDFDEAGEQVMQGFAIASGNTIFPSIDVPADAVTGNTYARFRISSTGNLGPTGAADDGEVEDYVFTIVDAPGSVGDTVFEDLNGNGIQDAGDFGVAGVTVNLFDVANNFIDARSTDGNGFYRFDDIQPGEYYIAIEVPFGRSLTLMNVGGDDEFDSDFSPISALSDVFTIAPGQTRIDVDAGLAPQQGGGAGSISGVKFNDLDGDGVRDAGEPGIEGVTIYLDLNENGIFDAGIDVSTLTDATGAYSFTNLDPGIYRVREIVPQGSIQTLPATNEELFFQTVSTGFNLPLYATAPAGDTGRLFVVEQSGSVQILNLADNSVNPQRFVTITDLAFDPFSFEEERGLLGLAFHPQYATNGLFYVDYINAAGDTVVQEFQVSGNNADVADPQSGRVILTIAQPDPYHNGGWIGFGPDGFLYIATGDGNGDVGNDPLNNAQDITNNLLGKILRVDVSGDDFPADANRNYAIPATNPFVGVTGDDEIWAYGLRNPWRNSFDRSTGDFFIADVGQDAREELNIQSASSTGGENYGWRLREGSIATPGSVGGAKPVGNVDPTYDYSHGGGEFQGDSIVGGYVYRGPLQSVQGLYFFADFVNGNVWTLDPAAGDIAASVTRVNGTIPVVNGFVGNPASFGEDALGNLYLIDYFGTVARLEATVTGGEYVVDLAAQQNVSGRDFGNIEPAATAPEIAVRGNNVVIVDGDVTPSATDGTLFADTLVDGGLSQRTFTIVNTGTAALDLTGSPIVTLSGVDAPFFTVAMQPGVTSLAPNQSTTFTITFDPDDTRVYNVDVSIGNNDADENPYTFAIAGRGATTIEVMRLGKDAGGSTKEVIDDDLGNSFELSFPGAGSLIVLKEADGRLSLRVEDSDAKTVLTVKAKVGDGTIQNLDIMGDVKGVVAKAINFLGNINVLGKIASFVGGNVADQHLIDFGGAPTDKPMKVVFDNLVNVTMTSGAPIDLTVVSWTDDDNDVNPDSLTAPSAKKITVKGDKKNGIAALWEADVILTGAGNPKQTLGGFAAETLREAAFNITGDAGSIALKGPVSDALVTITGASKGFSAAGDLTNVTLNLAQGTSKITGKKATNVNLTGSDYGSLAFNTIEGGDFTVDSIKSLVAKADKKTGDVGAINNLIVDLAGSNNPKVKDTLGSLKADGGSTNLDVELFGSGGSVDIKGAIDQLLYAASGNIKSIKLGDVASATLDGDSVGSVQAVRWLTGQAIFTDLKSLKTTGDKKTNTPGDLGASIGINPGGVSTAKVELGGAKIAGTLTGLWNIFGSTGAIAADAIDAGFDAVIEFDVKALSSKAQFDGFIAARSFGKIDVKTTMTAATIIAFSIPGESSSIGSLKTGGDVTGGTRIYVGVDPVDDTIDDDNDVLKGGPDNFIKSLTIGGDAAADTEIAAGAFPKTVSINKTKIDPLTDDRFTLS